MKVFNMNNLFRRTPIPRVKGYNQLQILTNLNFIVLLKVKLFIKIMPFYVMYYVI